AVVSSRTTTTGQVACADTYWLTEPRIIAVKVPMPRAPTTSIDPLCPGYVSACAGAPGSLTTSTSRSGATAAARSAAAARARSRFFTSVSDTVSRPDTVSRSVIRGGSAPGGPNPQGKAAASGV